MNNYSMVTLLTLCHVHWQFNNASFGPMSVEGTCSSPSTSVARGSEQVPKGVVGNGKHDFIDCCVTTDEFSTVSGLKVYMWFGVLKELLRFAFVGCPLLSIQLSLAFWLHTLVSCLLSDVTLNSHYLLEIISRLSLKVPLLSLMSVHW